MSKTSRKARRGPRPRVIRTAADLDAAGGAISPDMPCRATYLTDPVLGGMQPDTLGPGGRLAADTSGTTEPVPALLFEPTQALMMENTATGTVQEARTERIIAAGFTRVNAGPTLALAQIP